MAEEVIGLLFGVEGVGVDGKSGKIIVDGLTKIVNDINSGKSTVPKIKLEFDVTGATDAVNDLIKKLDKIGKDGGKGAGGAVSKKIQAETAKYAEYQKIIKQWVKDSKTAAKLAEEYTGLSRNIDGSITGSGGSEQYDKTVTSINSTVEALKTLQIAFVEVDDASRGLKKGDVLQPNEGDFQRIASEIGITEEQYRKLFDQMKNGAATAQINVQNANRKNQQSWTATSSKIRDEVQRMYDTIAKDPNAKKMADDILEYSKSAEGSVGDLKNKYDELRNAIHESGADVETWGDKFKKTFAGKVRSALAGAITAAFTKYLREIYTNVVNIDKALVNLQIATGKSREETKALVKEYANLAKQLGATATEVAEAADTWLRQGYSTQETNTLIKNSTMLAKLGQMEAAEASKALTSAMKGYKVEVEASIGIIDKFTAVDMEAAASAGDIATAMAETATSADIAGVSMDKLIGYIATVKEVTQDGAESVGTFYKTLFARMNNVKAGKFVDDETGESLNDVETVLGELDIKLRRVNGTFRDSGDVLDEVAARWTEFDNVQQHAIATAFAGTRQQEKFIVLMENYGTAMKYAETATESAGTANEKYQAHLDGIQGKLNALKATFEELSMSVLNSDWLAGGIDFLRSLLSVLDGILSFGDSFLVKTALIVGVIYLVIALYGKLNAAFISAKLSITELIGLQAALNGTQAAGATTTSLLTAALVKYSSTGLLGVITTIPRAIAAIVIWISSNIKAKAATDASTASTITLNAAMNAMNVNPFILAITATIAAIAALVAILKTVDTAWEKTYKKAKDAANEQQQLIDKYDSEIDALETLQKKLVDAQGSRQKLSSLYSELNGKVAVSTGLLQGEEAAYKAVNAQLQDQINATKKLREEALKSRISHERNAFDKQKAKRYGGWGWDWTQADTNGNTMRDLMSGDTSKWTPENATYVMGKAMVGQNGINPKEVGKYLNYEVFYEKLNQSQQNLLLDAMGFTADSWGEYWDNQVATAKSVFEDTIKDSTGAFGSAFMESALDRLIRGGHNLDSAGEILSELSGGSDIINEQVSKYYEARETGAPNVENLYNTLIATLDSYIQKFPELSKIFATFISTIPSVDNATKGITVALKSEYDILEEVQGGYDGLSKALSSVTNDGYLTADALSTLFKLEKDNALAGLELEKILEKDANGYKLSEDALQKYIQALISAYTIEGTFATQQDKLNAIANLQALQAVLATLVATQEESTDASKERQEELEKEQDMYQDQLDKFEELINLRKDLLQTYKEELDYQKELEKRQRNVTSLQTKLAVARLDGSAAGQARVRELEAQLQEAQDELEDFTLEHAIDVLTDQLDRTNAEWKAIIQDKLDEISTLLKGLDAAPDVNVSIDTTWAKDAFSRIEELIRRYTLVPFSGPANKESALQFGENKLDFKLEAREYHSGGIVGNVSNFSSSEEFAKLLKGEFVSTPTQMKHFMEDTLPRISGYTSSGATNEFNAPLIEIMCERVTTEALPELERVVNEAVKEIKKQLDSGMSRTGYKRTPTKRLT